MKQRILTNLFATVLALCIPSASAFAQTTKQVKVSVSDSSGPLIGAGVLIQGTTNGAVTDADGNATLNVPQGSSLEISMIGYASQTVKFEGGGVVVGSSFRGLRIA